MKASLPFILLSSLLFASCSTTPSSPAVETITIQYTPAAEPWLAALYDCAGSTVVTADSRAADFLDPQATDLVIRLGQPGSMAATAYKIGSEDILVIVNRQNPINTLTPDQVRELFGGQIPSWKEINGSDAAVQVWAFGSGEDVEQLFVQTALGGSPVTSTARLATGPEEMSQAIAKDVNAVGFLTRHWKAGNVADVFTVATVPVLALSAKEPREAVQGILGCLQK
jgi:hypothetical protein